MYIGLCQTSPTHHTIVRVPSANGNQHKVCICTMHGQTRWEIANVSNEIYISLRSLFTCSALVLLPSPSPPGLCIPVKHDEQLVSMMPNCCKLITPGHRKVADTIFTCCTSLHLKLPLHTATHSVRCSSAILDICANFCPG